MRFLKLPVPVTSPVKVELPVTLMPPAATVRLLAKRPSPLTSRVAPGLTWPMPTLPLARTVRTPGSYQVLKTWTMTWPEAPLKSASAIPMTWPALVAFMPLLAALEVVM